MHLQIPADRIEENVWFAPEVYADMTGDRWIIATSAELLRDATRRRKSLREDAGFLAARARHTAGERVLFVVAQRDQGDPITGERVGM